MSSPAMVVHSATVAWPVPGAARATVEALALTVAAQRTRIQPVGMSAHPATTGTAATFAKAARAVSASSSPGHRAAEVTAYAPSARRLLPIRPSAWATAAIAIGGVLGSVALFTDPKALGGLIIFSAVVLGVVQQALP
jgi:hypothetical protein